MDPLERAMAALFTFFMGFFLMYAAIVTYTLWTGEAWGEEHPPEHMTLHRQFYSNWMIPRPDDPEHHRTVSCCNEEDCYPASTKNEGGTWFYLHRETQQWMVIPEERLEHNQVDFRESPDGRGHVCANAQSGFVYCAVLGIGI